MILTNGVFFKKVNVNKALPIGFAGQNFRFFALKFPSTLIFYAVYLGSI